MMACLKCGKATAEDKSFCEECREVMAQYPVKPNTPVQIPKRAAVPEEKKPPRKVTPAKQDDFDRLRSCIRWLTATVGIMTILICLLAGLLLNTLGDIPESNVIGKNYTVTERDN